MEINIRKISTGVCGEKMKSLLTLKNEEVICKNALSRCRCQQPQSIVICFPELNVTLGGEDAAHAL